MKQWNSTLERRTPLKARKGLGSKASTRAKTASQAAAQARQRQIREADSLHRQLIFTLCGHACSVKGCKCHPVERHHPIGCATLGYRWHPDNGIPLCVDHHRLSSQFSAHLTPVKFKKWLKAEYPEVYAFWNTNRNKIVKAPRDMKRVIAKLERQLEAMA